MVVEVEVVVTGCVEVIVVDVVSAAVEVVELLIVDVVPTVVDVVSPVFLMYKFNLPPLPQYSPVLPLHNMLHSESGLSSDSARNVLPHQHSRPYSTPAYLASEHCSRHFRTVNSSEAHSVDNARPVEGSL